MEIQIFVFLIISERPLHQALKHTGSVQEILFLYNSLKWNNDYRCIKKTKTKADIPNYTDRMIIFAGGQYSIFLLNCQDLNIKSVKSII